MYSIASSTADLTTAFSNVGILIALAVGTVLVAWASLIGLGFGTRKATKHVTGKRF